jgi:hypothetical protein
MNCSRMRRCAYARHACLYTQPCCWLQPMSLWHLHELAQDFSPHEGVGQDGGGGGVAEAAVDEGHSKRGDDATKAQAPEACSSSSRSIAGQSAG